MAYLERNAEAGIKLGIHNQEAKGLSSGQLWRKVGKNHEEADEIYRLIPILYIDN
jgi:hypothetical protein